MHGRRPGFVLSALLATLLAVAPVRLATGEDGSAGRVAVGNTAYVRADAAWLRQALDRAETAIQEGNWPGAVRHLQEIVDTVEDSDEAGATAPDVLPVFGAVVYEGAWIVAHHRILRGGAPALEAYARLYGGEADALLARGLEGRDPAFLAEAADRFLPLPQGRRAALLLADLALEAGDRDGAVGWLERLEDLEEVTTEPTDSLAPWRRLRTRLLAAVLARPDRVEAVEAGLLEAAVAAPAGVAAGTPVPLADRHASPALLAWPTTGGCAARDGLPPAMGPALTLAWWREFPSLGFEDPFGNARGSPDGDAGPRPSPWLPSRAVVDWPLAFVSNGAHVCVWDLETGRRAADPFPLLGIDPDYLLRPSEAQARAELGLLEGFALTLGEPDANGHRLVYVASPDLLKGQEDWTYDNLRQDGIRALAFDGRRLIDVWGAGGTRLQEGMPPGTRLYGAPLLYRDRLWVAGVRPTSEVQAEAWLFGLSPTTGAVEVRTHLGTGGPARAHRPEESIPSSPAGANGRVVVSTALGVVGAVDARTGRPVWLYKNDRGVTSAGRPAQRLARAHDTTARERGFVNQPPLLAQQWVFVAPTDGPFLYSLFDRPRGPSREIVRYRLDMVKAANHFTVEQIAGLHPGGRGVDPILVLVGKGASPEGGNPAPIAVGLDPATLTRRAWHAVGTTGYGAEPYGMALMTAGEVWIPQRQGVGVYDLTRGRDLATLDLASVPPRLRKLVPEPAPLSGNVIPVPGRGILVLNTTHGSFWRLRGR